MSGWRVGDIAVARTDMPEAQVRRGDRLNVVEVVNQKRFGLCLRFEDITYMGHPLLIEASGFLRIVSDERKAGVPA